MPTISGTTLTGTKVTVPGLAAGRPTVLNVWGAWCPSCREEAPMLQAAAAKLGDRSSFLGVDVRDTRDNAGAYERRFGITYPSLFDPDGRSLLRLPRGVTLPAIPSTLVLDGHVASRPPSSGRSRAPRLSSSSSRTPSSESPHDVLLPRCAPPDNAPGAQ